MFIDSRARSAGEGGGGLFGDVLGFFQGNWFFGSPATLILAIALIVLMFVAPFGIIGLLKRLAHRFVVIVPRPAGTHDLVPVEALVADEIEPSPI